MRVLLSFACKAHFVVSAWLSLYFITRVPLCEKNAFVFLWIWREFQHQTAHGVQVAGICAKGREEWKENNKKTNEQIIKHAKTHKETNKQTMKLAPSPIFAPFSSRLLHYLHGNTWRQLNCSRLYRWRVSEGQWKALENNYQPRALSISRTRLSWSLEQARWEQAKNLLYFVYVFSEFMNSSSVKDPPELKRKMELFTAEQSAVNKKRMELLESLRFVYWSVN